ncbi:MAG: hypothetical protein ACKVWV_01985 [Planctomycetota bacterium]
MNTSRARCSIYTAFVVVALGSPRAAAQSVYIDLGSGFAPSSSYAAASGIPGYWNRLGGLVTSMPLLDLSAQPTQIVAHAEDCDWGGIDSPTTEGDDEALLDDWHYADCAFATPRTIITGLAAGTYRVFAYPPGDGGGPMSVSAYLSPGGPQGGVTIPAQAPFPGSFDNWIVGVFDLHVEANDTGLSLGYSASNRGFTGFQIVRFGEAPLAGTAYCFGDGTGATCPCGNPGNAGRGCANLTDSRGALLAAIGTPSVLADTLTLMTTSMSGFQSWYFQGTAQDALPFGRGIQCLSGTIVRVGMKGLMGGASSNPSGVDLPISVKGAVPPAGGTRHYQVAYRQVNPPCTPTPISNTNRTNGVTIVWTP